MKNFYSYQKGEVSPSLQSTGLPLPPLLGQSPKTPVPVDFHIHLDWYDSAANLDQQIKDFSGILVAASVDALSYEKNLQLAKKYTSDDRLIIPTFGIHPEKVIASSENLSIYNKLCEASPLIGEIGMDFCWYKDASPLQQEKVFRYFMEHCHNHKKYCVIHTKDAEKEICRILEDYPEAKPIIHWYDGSEDIYQEFIKRGYFQTFGCQTSRSKHIQKLLTQTPLSLLLCETDNPTAEPWLGGTDNSLNLINRIYNDIAVVLNVHPSVIKAKVFENSVKILSSL